MKTKLLERLHHRTFATKGQHRCKGFFIIIVLISPSSFFLFLTYCLFLGFGSSTFGAQENPFARSTSQQKPFGSSGSIFGTPSTTTSSIFGSPAANSGSIFGTPASTSSSAFGSATTTSSIFGGGSSSPFGAKPAFGQSSNFGSSTFGQPSTFGQSSFSTGVFGSPSGPFSGGNQGVAQTGFGTGSSAFQGTSGFGAPASFGSSPSGFGSPPTFGSAPVFGSGTNFGSPGKVFGGGAANGELFLIN